MGYWDKFQGQYKFVEKGDTIEGTITDLRVAKFSNGDVPEIHLRTKTGLDRWVTAGQTVLISRLAEAAPEVGDWIRIEYLGESDKKAPGRDPAKLFDVTVKREADMGGGRSADPLPTTEGQSDEPF